MRRALEMVSIVLLRKTFKNWVSLLVSLTRSQKLIEPFVPETNGPACFRLHLYFYMYCITIVIDIIMVVVYNIIKYYKLNPLHSKHVVFLIDVQFSSNYVWKLTLYKVVGMVGRLQPATACKAPSIVNHLAWYSKSVMIPISQTDDYHCYIIKEWFFLYSSFFVNYILSFSLVRLWTIQFS